MKKIFLLVFISFLLTSCSWIKIVFEKDCDCKCDKNIINNTNSWSNLDINWNKNFLDDTEEILEKPPMLRYLTWKFTLNWDNNYIYVYYKNTKIAKFEKSISNFSQEQLEENPMIKESKEVLKLELAKRIKVKNIKQNFYLVELENSNKKFLFDKKNLKTWNISFINSPFKKVIFWRSWKYLMYFWWKKCNWWLIYINNKTQKLKKVFENDCNYIWEYPENYKEITNFELWDWIIKVYYIDYLWDKNIEKILLDNIK